jgi:hypothetical protein
MSVERAAIQPQMQNSFATCETRCTIIPAYFAASETFPAAKSPVEQKHSKLKEKLERKISMKRNLYFVAGLGLVTIVAIGMHLAPTASATGFQSTSTPPIHISQQTQFGMMSVNETTGAISFCANNTVVPGSGGGQAPIGTCSASSIGSVTPTVGSNNSLSIEGSGLIANGSGTAALVYNNQTGQAVLCAGSGVVSGGVANVVASCKSVANLH